MIFLDSELLKYLIYSQHEVIQNEVLVPRNVEFEPNDNYVLVGMRRAGKTLILYQLIQELIENGVDWEQIVFLNFEDERLINIKLEELDKIILVAQSLTKKPIYYFFDEIQNIAGWEHFARRLADQKQRVFITGSNSKMLSTDIIASLGGRYMMKRITPYDFKEYLLANDVKYDKSSIYIPSKLIKILKYSDQYLRFGGLPETLLQNNPRDYLNNIYQNIYLGDIIKRNQIRNPKALSLLINKVAQVMMHEVSYNTLSKNVKATGVSISTPATIDYLKFAKEALLLFDIKNYVAKFSQKEITPKFYFCDNGILNLFLFKKDPALLENLVAVTLYNRFEKDVYYFHSPKTKIDLDFVVPSAELAIQVAWQLDDFSRERELESLIKLAQNSDEFTKFIIVTKDQNEMIIRDNLEIEVMQLHKFLLTYTK